MQRAKSEYAIQTVTNALRVLEAFETDEQLGVTELARRLHLHKNAVFRLLATLEENRWVEQTDAELSAARPVVFADASGHAPRATGAGVAVQRDRRDDAPRRAA